jgi:hypothetical protein
MKGRDNFTAKTRRNLGERVGYRCSCPTCRRLTIGPTKDISAPLLVAEAAHITAAAERGPRFDDRLTPEERSAVANGIWLCATCHTMVDKDRTHFSDDLLRKWKADAEDLARREVEGEVIFSGYIDPTKAAAAYFATQLEQYSVTRQELGADARGLSIPVVWIQFVTTATLKELIKLNPSQMGKHVEGFKPVMSERWGTDISRFGVHVAGYGYTPSGAHHSLRCLLQLFKDGSVAIGFVMFEHTGLDFPLDYVKAKVIPWVAFENRVLTNIEQGLKVIASLEVPHVGFVRLTVKGMQGYGAVSDPGRPIQHNPSDTDTIESAPSMVRSFDLPATEIARPLLEEFWQHLGVAFTKLR